MLSTPDIFSRYEEIRFRLPQAQRFNVTRDIDDLNDIAEQAKAFVFDAFGVLNVGETLIKGADQRLRELRALGCKIRILTNASSYDRFRAIEKFSKLGIEIEDDEIITSRDAALLVLTSGLWGVIAAKEDNLSDLDVDYVRLADHAQDYDLAESFLFLSSSGWTEVRQQLLKQSLLKNDRSVIIANSDIVAPRDDGFSLEPGHFGHNLADCGIKNVRFFGKPFPEVYDLVEASLSGIPVHQIAMCGDTLHTDILGAAARGWQTVLVTQDGLFSGHDTKKYSSQSKIYPDWRVTRI